eukprot:gnl/TRDRNA2_/TRDRNA2_46742_c0_seq1.p1 gnl/TRDRNA2_/TRDRNA2_46742_c0~~gnl/TRDRNA2_/TRDRNA2_46742_c0_seq1.p1  ORF type:complete len:136 (+),score=27.66 gnl/TRDRNA2_/TRDRNA2_46742_c0_seq1:120-527(+)
MYPEPVGAPKIFIPPEPLPFGFVSLPIAAEEVKRKKGCRTTVNGKDLAVFWFKGSFFAVDADCPHQGAALEVGDIEDLGCGPVVKCPHHGWCFELRSGFCEDIYDYGLNAYDVICLAGDELCVSLKQLPQPERGE